MTEEEFEILKQLATDTRTTKNILIFFCVLACISILLGIIAFADLI